MSLIFEEHLEGIKMIDTVNELERKIAAMKNCILELRHMQEQAAKIHALMDSTCDIHEMDLCVGSLKDKLDQLRACLAEALGH